MLEGSFIDGVAALAQDEWDSLQGSDPTFLRWAYLRAIESASATPEHGVVPHHFILREDGELVAACLLYVKGDGRGEFIYDFQWHGLADHLGIPYYPKGLSMVPFTPATCSHFLFRRDSDRARLMPAVVDAVEDWARAAGLHGVHYLFVEEAEAQFLVERGYLHRLSTRLVLENPGWKDLEGYLACFRARHRTKLRRELRRVEEQGLAVQVLEGTAIEARHLEAMQEFYLATCAAHGTGSDYLKPGSWQHLFEDCREQLLLCLASDGDRLVGGSLCVKGQSELHGRYWGSLGGHNSLYFNLAILAPLRVMIERGWTRFLAGFGNSVGKYIRGFLPEATHSAHVLFEPRLMDILSEHLETERRLVREAIDAGRSESRLRLQD